MLVNKPSETKIPNGKSKIVEAAKLIPMKSIDEEMNEDSARNEIEVKVKSEIIKINEEQIE